MADDLPPEPGAPAPPPVPTPEPPTVGRVVNSGSQTVRWINKFARAVVPIAEGVGVFAFVAFVVLEAVVTASTKVVNYYRSVEGRPPAKETS